MRLACLAALVPPRVGALLAAAACLAWPRPAGSASLPPSRGVWAWPAAAAVLGSRALSLGRAAPLGFAPFPAPFFLPALTGGGEAARRAGWAGGALLPAASPAHGLAARRQAGLWAAAALRSGAPLGCFRRKEKRGCPLPPLRLPPPPPPPPPPRLLPPSRPPLGASGARSHRGAQTGPAAAALAHNGAETHQQGRKAPDLRLRLGCFRVSRRQRFGFGNCWDVIANAVGAQWRYREVAVDLCSYASYVEHLRISRAERSFLVIS
ncbi:ubiquitin-conjugating enzyme E2 D3 isoform 1-T1 [Morphnus guianensis]